MPKSTKFSLRAIINLVAACYVKISYKNEILTKMPNFTNLDFLRGNLLLALNTKLMIYFLELSHIDAHHLKAIEKGFQNLVLVCWSDAYKPSYTNLKFSHSFGWFLGNLKNRPKCLSKGKAFWL